MAGPQRTPELPSLILTQCDLNEYNTISVSGIRILRLKWCWNSDVADVCVDYCEWKMVDCWMSSFFMSLGNRVKTNPHETAALVHDLLAGTLWELVCSMSLAFVAVTVHVAELHGKTKNRNASWENGERRSTLKPERRGVQEPRYKSVERGESDHTLFMRAILSSLPCRPSPVRLGWGKEEK